jgi:hypothetical protein
VLKVSDGHVFFDKEARRVNVIQPALAAVAAN